MINDIESFFLRSKNIALYDDMVFIRALMLEDSSIFLLKTYILIIGRY